MSDLVSIYSSSDRELRNTYALSMLTYELSILICAYCSGRLTIILQILFFGRTIFNNHNSQKIFYLTKIIKIVKKETVSLFISLYTVYYTYYLQLKLYSHEIVLHEQKQFCSIIVRYSWKYS